MNKFIKKLTITGLSLIALAFLNIANVQAWGPERETFTMEEPATYPTFNSITNNPTIGDERDFVRIGEIDADVTELTNEVEIVPGRQYLVYIYFHNNASSTLNDSAHGNAGVALKTRMSSSFSTVLTPEEQGKVTATITADNSTPESVWDEAYMTTSTGKVLLHYVAGSAKIYNDWRASGSVMPSSLFTEQGTLLGLNALNGVIPGCEEYHGVVTYVLQAEELGGSLEKFVSSDGAFFGPTTDAKPGDEIYFRLKIENTGDVALTNVTIKDELPAGLQLVPGSVGLRANDSDVTDPLSDNIIRTGYNLGTVGTGNVVYITYRATVTGDYDCTARELKNQATLTYDSEVASGDSKTAISTVLVKRNDCTESETPLDDCSTNPGLPGCEKPQPTEDCVANPSLPECQKGNDDPKPEPEPEPEKNCKTNPEMPECRSLPNTGPLQIILALLVVAGISGGGFYYYQTRKKLQTVKDNVSGKDIPDTPDTPSQDGNNMVQ